MSLAALGVGLGLGIALHGSDAPWVATLAGALMPLGRFWIAVLQFLVVPLVVTQAMAAVMKVERLGALGIRTFGLFVALLLAASLFTLLIGPPLVRLYPVDPGTISALRAGVSVPEATRDIVERDPALIDWVRGFLPASASRVFRGANLLPILLGAVLLAILARRFAGRRREILQRRIQWLADAMMTLLGWVLVVTPIGVLALTFGLALSAGGSAVGLLTFYVVVVSGLMLAFTALLYPITAILSGTPLSRFARAVAPAQLVALSTRSSLASLPVLVESGRDRLALPAGATGFVLPLAVATFKLNMPISSGVMLLFLAHTFGVPLAPDRIFVFFATVLLISFTAPGIPGGDPLVATLPLFAAAGVPLEGVLILEVVEAIPDIFKTIINVTADLSAAVIVTRRSRRGSAA